MRFFTLLIALFSLLGASAQVTISANTKADIQVIQKDLAGSKNIPSSLLIDRFAIHKFSDGYFVGFLAKTSSTYSKNLKSEYGNIWFHLMSVFN